MPHPTSIAKVSDFGCQPIQENILPHPILPNVANSVVQHMQRDFINVSPLPEIVPPITNISDVRSQPINDNILPIPIVPDDTDSLGRPMERNVMPVSQIGKVVD